MDIRIFVYALLGLSAAAYFLPVENLTKTNVDKDIPLVVFEEPLMYTLDEVGVSRVVQSSHAVRYKNRDEMFNADIILKNRAEKKTFDLEKLKAKTIIKKGDDFTLLKDVNYKRDNFVNLDTQEMYYNLKTRIAYNNIPYEGTYNKHYLKGTKLYLEGNKSLIKSKDVHFEIDMKNKK